MKKLKPLKWYPHKIYGYDTNGKWTLLEDEKQDWERNDIIKNYSGGVSIK